MDNKIGDVLRKSALTTLVFLLGTHMAFAADQKALAFLDKASLLEQVVTLAPEIRRGIVELREKQKMCSYFRSVFESGTFEENVMRPNSTKEFILLVSTQN